MLQTHHFSSSQDFIWAPNSMCHVFRFEKGIEGLSLRAAWCPSVIRREPKNLSISTERFPGVKGSILTNGWKTVKEDRTV